MPPPKLSDSRPKNWLFFDKNASKMHFFVQYCSKFSKNGAFGAVTLYYTLDMHLNAQKGHFYPNIRKFFSSGCPPKVAEDVRPCSPPLI